MVPSAVVNEAIVFAVVLSMIAVIRRTPKEKRPGAFRYFTVLSNLFCGLAALILLLCELFGSMPLWAAALKYAGTVALAVTLCTVLFYLLPLTRSLRGLLDGPELFLHLVIPALAILSFLCFEKQGLSAWIIPLGVAPVLLYGWLYLDRVVFKGTWEDMYGFNRNGKWKLSFSLMAAGAAVVAVLLWAL